MKVFLGLTLLVAVAVAEPPTYRQRSQPTYYVARQEAEPEAEAAPAAPYQPSGWKPDGPAFELPQKQQQLQQYGAPATPQKQYGTPSAPQNQYGAPATPQKQYGTPKPQQSYGTPQQQYGPPTPQQNYPTTTTTDYPTATDYEDHTNLPSDTTDSQSEPVDSVNELDEVNNGNNDDQKQTGEYYIALPDGKLQRVTYVSNQDYEAMKYFARIQAENIEPLRGPIYAYQPLRKLEFAPAKLQLSPMAVETIAVAPVNNGQRGKITPVKLQVEPLAAKTPVSSFSNSYAAASPANYQLPAAEQRYFITF